VPGTTVEANFNGADELCNTSTTGSPAACSSSAFTYDNDGSETHDAQDAITSSYNSRDFTKAVTQGGTTYDYVYADINQSERTSMTNTTTGTKTYFVNSPDGVTSSTVIPTSGGTTSAYYTRDSGGNLVDERTSSGTYYYLTDIRGSVIGLINASGVVSGTYTYDPYGNVTNTLTSTAQANPWRFDGAYQDPSGEYHMGARYYAPTLARWTQRDIAPGSVANVNTIDRYLFAGDDPVNEVDPSGLSWWNPITWSSGEWWQAFQFGADAFSCYVFAQVGFALVDIPGAIVGCAVGWGVAESPGDA
jgi:RHS repeat-associated protein